MFLDLVLDLFGGYEILCRHWNAVLSRKNKHKKSRLY